MKHAFDIQVRIFVDEDELQAGELPREAAQRYLREWFGFADEEVRDIHEVA